MRANKFVLIGLAITATVGLSAVAIRGQRDDTTKGLLSPSSTSISPAAASPAAVTLVASRLDWPDVAALVGASDLIAVVTWSRDREELVSVPAADGSAKDSRVDVLRSFETVEVLKGTNIPVTFDATIARSNQFAPRPNIPGGFVLEQEIVELEATQRYVVFLADRTGVGDARFIFRGEPSIARIDGDRLVWVVTADYLKGKEHLGVGRDGAVARFDGQTLSGLQSIVRGQGGSGP